MFAECVGNIQDKAVNSGGKKKSTTVLSEAFSCASCLQLLPVDSTNDKRKSTLITAAAFLDAQCRHGLKFPRHLHAELTLSSSDHLRLPNVCVSRDVLLCLFVQRKVQGAL